jgi:hypothetical protein
MPEYQCPSCGAKMTQKSSFGSGLGSAFVAVFICGLLLLILCVMLGI